MLATSDGSQALTLLFSCLVLSGCGASVVFGDEEGGAPGDGGSSDGGASNNGGTIDTGPIPPEGGSSSTGDVCDQLEKELVLAIEAARFCSPLDPNIQCDGTVTLLDTCGCPSFVANEDLVEEVQTAKLAYETWVDAGCGPYPCESCTPAMGGFCESLDGGASGQCQALTLN